MMQKLKQWLAKASVAEQNELAQLAGTSRNYLHQIAGGHRKASAELAGRIEGAAADVRTSSKGRLDKLKRGDVAQACAECPYFRRCTHYDRNRS